jgi:ParB family chromosome partitioning protein
MHKALGKGLESLIGLSKTVQQPQAINLSNNIAGNAIASSTDKGQPNLLGEPIVGATSIGETINIVSLDKIKPNKYQPRVKFDADKLNELAESIKNHGLAQPLVVTQSDAPGEYELVAGERRLRACRMAGLEKVSVIVKQVNDKQKFELSLVENLQREDLDPIEEAKAYSRLNKEFSLTQEDLARVLGKDRSVVANSMRLLNLSKEIQDAISAGQIAAGHGRVLAGIDDKIRQKELADAVVKDKLSVRELEKLVSGEKLKKSAKNKSNKKMQDASITATAEELQRMLGTRVKIIGSPKKGKIEIHYFSLEDLERIIKLFKK